MERALFQSYNGGRSMLCFPSKFHPDRPCVLARHLTMTPATTLWDSINLHVETHLEKSMPARAVPSVSEPLRRLTLAAPRSPAPALCIAACELVGGSMDQAVDAAAALHLVHAAAFVHDSLLMTGRPEAQPGLNPTSHLGYGPNIELLTADGMLPLAVELLARPSDPTRDNSPGVLRVMVEILRAVGSQGVVGGQYYGEKMGRAGSSSGSLDLTVWADHVVGKREGRLHACAGACGAILGGGTEEEIERLRAYGYCVGMIQGISQYGGGGKMAEEELKKIVEEMRRMAMKNLRGFDEAKAEEMSSILND